ncbi:CbiQ family ECF transporter T component [Methylotenera sp. L2L1]|uniref:CbiQ family ECF transporter T component n=1 Tax=Methylotenera sp. L2L1 TaxID=1502770 RepID=UPI00056837D0|nr:CbiQ family ECF transporter T component [Methylotenera sp. L2L1]
MHPFVKMLMFLLMLLLAGIVGNQLLILIMLVLSVMAIKLQLKIFFATLRRMRWLSISIFLIYAFGTPGEMVQPFPLSLAPSYEGLHLGLLQISRLLIALAALNVLLATSTKEELMLALYMLLQPLKYAGLDVEKFSVRLLLTLNYVDELAIKGKTSFSFKHFNDIHRELDAMPTVDVVYFENKSFNLVDKITMVVMVFVLGVMITMGA